MSFPTPPTAEGTSTLSATQLESVKKSLEIYGNEIFPSVKTALNHEVAIVEMKTGFSYLVENDSIINHGDTISDAEANSFTVEMKGSNYVGGGGPAKVRIVGAKAIISRYDYYKDFNGNFVFEFGTSGTGNLQFSSSSDGIDINRTNIFVVDKGNDRVQIIDLVGNYVSQFGTSGIGNDNFDNPSGIYINDTNIFITDSGNNRVKIHTLDGAYVSEFGTFGTGDGQFDNPKGITGNSTNLFVVDTDNNRIQKFDLVGAFVSKFGTIGTGNDQFNKPRGIALNSNNLFITDTGNDRVQMLDLTGAFVSQFGTSGLGSGELNVPSGIKVNSTNIFIANTNNNKVSVFDLSGTNDFIYELGISGGSSAGSFIGLIDIAINDENIFVTDAAVNNRIQILK